MYHILTGSLPSMASSQSLRLASENACNVMIPCLLKTNTFQKNHCGAQYTHTHTNKYFLILMFVGSKIIGLAMTA